MGDVSIAKGRSCDGCTLCCKLLSIEELSKPRLKWCEHCDVRKGCKIYDRRPPECKNFYCNYLLDDRIEENWNPLKSKMVLAYESHANRIAIHVDPYRGDAWRKEPFYSQIKEWAIAASENQGQVIVWQGNNVIAVLPDREKDLGSVRQDQFIITAEKAGPSGPEFDVMVIDNDDPILKNLPNVD